VGEGFEHRGFRNRNIKHFVDQNALTYVWERPGNTEERTKTVSPPHPRELGVPTVCMTFAWNSRTLKAVGGSCFLVEYIRSKLLLDRSSEGADQESWEKKGLVATPTRCRFSAT